MLSCSEQRLLRKPYHSMYSATQEKWGGEPNYALIYGGKK